MSEELVQAFQAAAKAYREAAAGDAERVCMEELAYIVAKLIAEAKKQ